MNFFILDESKLIGCGGSRQVYEYGDYVVKIPHCANGKEQSAREYELWQNPKYSPYIAEVIDYNAETGVIVMERLSNCCMMSIDRAEIANRMPSYYKEIVNNEKFPYLQVGYDKNGNLKIFDCGIEAGNEKPCFEIRQKINRLKLPVVN